MSEREGIDAEYLVRAQLAIDPDGFEQCVKEAFLLEHDCVEQQDIAELLGNDKSNVSHYFKEPWKVEAKTIRKLLSHLASPYHKKRIFDAWVKVAFGEDIKKRKGPVIGEVVPTRILRRLDRYLREQRLAIAADVATEALGKTEDHILRWRIVDRAFFARHRLDQMGHAMELARLTCEEAREHQEPWRYGQGLLFQVRVLESLPDSRPEEVFPILDALDALIAGRTPPSEPVNYLTALPERPDRMRIGVKATFIERGILNVPHAELRADLASLLALLKRTRKHRFRFMISVLASRLHLILGETFQARELIDTAFAASGVRHLQVFELLSLMDARIMRATGEPPDVVRAVYKEVSANCLAAQNRYHSRVAEYELARFEASRVARFH